MYNGDPSNGGTETCSSSQNNTSVSSTIQASPNTVSSVSYTAPYIGGNFTMTVIGTTGTIGSAGNFSYTPATLSTWNAACLKLTGSSITMTGGNTGTFTGGLYKTGLSSNSTNYTLVYTFSAQCVTSSSTPVAPLSYISSGNQIKHTSVSNYGTLPPIAPANNQLVMTKSVSPMASISGGTATYYLNVTNNGPTSATLDNFVDTLPSSPANVSYINGTAKFTSDNSVGGTTIADPTKSGQVLTWVGVYTIASGKTATLSFQATIPSTSGSYLNSAVAHVGTAQIDQTTDTTDNSPATASYGVGDPSMAASTKTVVDLNGTTVYPGDTLKYTITAVATGTNDATGVSITDNIDFNTNSVSNVVIGDNKTNCGTSYTNSSTTTKLYVTGITVTHGSSCVVTFTVTVSASAAAGTTILNSASIVPGNLGGISGSPSSTPLVVHRDPILSMTNTHNVSSNTAVAGQVITYTTTITNTGYGTASGVNLTGTVTGPVGSLSTRTLTNCGPSTTYVDTSALPTINIAALTITTSNPCVITYTVTVNTGTSSGTITNVDSATAAIEGGNAPADATAPAILIGATPTAPILAAVVTDGAPSATVSPGQSVSYTISTTNTGQTNATTSLTSAIPSGMGTPTSIQYSNCGTPSSSYSAPTLTVSSLTINAAATCVITFNLTINTPLNSGTTLTLTATPAKASQTGSNTPSTASDRTLTVSATPNLSLTVAHNVPSNTVKPNQDVTYTITLRNQGNGRGSGITLTDVLTGPVGNPFNFTITGCGSSYANSSTTSVYISGVAVNVGTNCVVSYHVIVNSTAKNGNKIYDPAQATSSTEGGNTPLPASAPDLLVSGTPNLVVALTNDSTANSVNPTQTVTFTTTINNNGSADATTSMSGTIPTGLGTPANFTYSSCGTPSSSYSSPNLSITNLSIVQGATCTITYTSVVASPQNNGTTLTVSELVSQANEGGNTPSTVSNTLTVSSSPTLSVTPSQNTGTNKVSPNQTITYTDTITNTGNGTASTSATVTIPSAVGNPSSITFTNCGSATSSYSSGTLTLSNLSITTSSNCVVTFNETVNSPGVQGASFYLTANVAKASEGGNTPSAVNSRTFTISLLTPNLITSTYSLVDHNGSIHPAPGDTIDFTLTIINTGNTSATGVSVTDSFNTIMNLVPSSITYTNCGSSKTSSSSTTLLSLSSLQIAVGTNCVIHFSATLKSPLNSGTAVQATATVSGASEGGNGANPSTHILYVTATPNLNVVSTHPATGTYAAPGQTITYITTITNSGNGDASGVSLIDSIIGQIGSVNSVTFSNCGSSYTNSTSGNVVLLSSIKITTTNPCVVTYSVVVNANASASSTVYNGANVSAAAEGGNTPATAEAPVIIVKDVPNLTTTVTDNTSSTNVKPGDSITFTITITNNGNGDADTNGTVIIPTTYLNGPYNITFTNCGESSSTYTAPDLNLNNLTISNSASCVITFTLIVNSPNTNGSTFNVTADINQATQGGNTPAPADSRLLTINTLPDLSSSTLKIQDLTESNPQPGDTVAYTLTVINTGSGNASGVNISDLISAYLTLDPTSVKLTNCGNSYSDSTNLTTLLLNNISVDIGTNCVIYFEAKIKTFSDSQVQIYDTATISGASEGGLGAAPSSNILTATKANSNTGGGTTGPATPTVTSTLLSGNSSPKLTPIRIPAKKPAAKPGKVDLTVVVLNESKEPIRNAKVSLRGSNLIEYTDKFGYVTFYGIPTGQKIVDVFYANKKISSPVNTNSKTPSPYLILRLNYVKDNDDWLGWLWLAILLVSLYMMWDLYDYYKFDYKERRSTHGRGRKLQPVH